MDHAHLLDFAPAYLAVLVLPGPGVTALVARVMARGTQGYPAFIAGFVIGALTWFTIAATGLAVLASTFAIVFVAIRYAGAIYLLYLAWKLWTAPVRPLGASQVSPDSHGRLFLTGLAINLGNPKVIVFFLALLPAVLDLGALTPLDFTQLALIITTIASTVLTAYALSAARARCIFTSPRAGRPLGEPRQRRRHGRSGCHHRDPLMPTPAAIVYPGRPALEQQHALGDATRDGSIAPIAYARPSAYNSYHPQELKRAR
jgi:threonine/homoserine/homoserine lactone efflux protein